MPNVGATPWFPDAVALSFVAPSDAPAQLQMNATITSSVGYNNIASVILEQT
jgi:hypothetical protein